MLDLSAPFFLSFMAHTVRITYVTANRASMTMIRPWSPHSDAGTGCHTVGLSMRPNISHPFAPVHIPGPASHWHGLLDAPAYAHSFVGSYWVTVCAAASVGPRHVHSIDALIPDTCRASVMACGHRVVHPFRLPGRSARLEPPLVSSGCHSLFVSSVHARLLVRSVASLAVS